MLTEAIVADFDVSDALSAPFMLPLSLTFWSKQGREDCN